MAVVEKMKTFAEANVDIKDQDIIQFLSAGEFKDGQWGQKFNIKVACANKRELLLSLNKSSFNRMIDFLGNDTNKWIGKEVRAHVVKQDVGGKLKNVIHVTDPAKDLEGNVVQQ